MLGEILREARKARKLTLRELSEKVGVTTGYLSHIENGRLEPSIAVLRKLTESLDIPANVALDIKKRKVDAVLVRKEERAKVRFGNLHGEAEVLTPFLWKSLLRPCMEAIELHVPGESSLTKEPISMETDEWIYVVKGAIEYRVGENVETLGAGDSIYIPKMTGHHLRNPLKETASIIWITHRGSFL